MGELEEIYLVRLDTLQDTSAIDYILSLWLKMRWQKASKSITTPIKVFSIFEGLGQDPLDEVPKNASKNKQNRTTN